MHPTVVWPARFGLGAWQDNPPLLTLAPESCTEFEIGKVPDADWVKGEDRDHQTVAKAACPGEVRAVAHLCLLHEGQARSDDEIRIDNLVSFCGRLLFEVEVLFDLSQPGEVAKRSQDFGHAANCRLNRER